MPHSKKWLVYDVDRNSDFGMDWIEREVAPPNFAVVNPENGHAHYVYILQTPVYMSGKVSLRAINYLHAVDEALTAKLGADKAYTKLICKNPFHEDWQYFPFHYDQYTLKELAEKLKLKKVRARERVDLSDSYGRNCAIFDAVRHFAYRIIREYDYSFNEFFNKLHERASGLNDEFRFTSLKGKLLKSELCGIIKSIAKWCWSRFSFKGFKFWADERRTNSLKVRQKKMNDRREELIKILEKQPNLSNRKLANLLGCSESTVRNDLKALSNENDTPQPPQFVISDISPYSAYSEVHNYANKLHSDELPVGDNKANLQETQESLVNLS
jgi:hypothetical protein